MTDSFTRSEIADLLRRGKRSRERARAASRLIRYWIFSAAILAIDATFFWMAVSVAHDEWLPTLPHIHWWTAVWIVFLLRGIFSQVRGPGAK